MKQNKQRKTTFLEGLYALVFAQPTNYDREYELHLKKEAARGAVLTPSQDVFKQMRKGQS